MSLLKLFMATSQTSNNGGGGDEDANAPIIMNVVTTLYDSSLRIIEGYIELSKPCPYDMLVQCGEDNNGDESYDIYLSAGDTYINFRFENPGYEMLQVYYLDPTDYNFRIIPSSMYCEVWPEQWFFTRNMGEYLYQTNINCIPVSSDALGTSSEPFPIKYIGDIDNSDIYRYIWYNYNGEILIRDTYYGQIYALNSSGVIYPYRDIGTDPT